MHTKSSSRSVCRGPRETREQALRRLAFQALAHGLRLFEYPRTREFYCSSSSQPDMLHRVTRLSCQNRGANSLYEFAARRYRIAESDDAN